MMLIEPLHYIFNAIALDIAFTLRPLRLCGDKLLPFDPCT